MLCLDSATDQLRCGVEFVVGDQTEEVFPAMTSSGKFHGGLSTAAPLPSCLSYEFDNHHPYTMYHVPTAIVTDLMKNSMK